MQGQYRIFFKYYLLIGGFSSLHRALSARFILGSFFIQGLCFSETLATIDWF